MKKLSKNELKKVLGGQHAGGSSDLPIAECSVTCNNGGKYKTYECNGNCSSDPSLGIFCNLEQVVWCN